MDKSLDLITDAINCGKTITESIFINALYKACDNLDIDFETQKKIVEGIKQYIR